MKRKFLSMLLILCMVISLMPLKVSASPGYELIIGGNDVTGYDDAVSYWKVEGGLYSKTGTESDYSFSVYYNHDTETFTLTLNGVDIAASDEYGIRCNGNLNIVLADGTENIVNVIYNTGVHVNGRITVNGNGSLDITTNDFYGIRGYAVSFENGDISIITNDTGIKITDGDMTISGGTVLNITAGEDAMNEYYGIMCDEGMIVIDDDARVSIEKFGEYGDGIWAESEIRISGDAQVKIIDWSKGDIAKCALHSENGNIAIGGSSEVDIVSQSAGIYTEQHNNGSVYIGYVWDGTNYIPSGSPTVKINKSDSIAAVTPLDDDDFIAGGDGICADGNVHIAGGNIEIYSYDIDACYGIIAKNRIDITGGIVTVTAESENNVNGLEGFNGLEISGGTITILVNGESACAVSIEAGDVVISGGTLTAGAANGQGEYGIVAPLGITITGGSVTAFGTMQALITYEGYGTITIDMPLYKHRTNTVPEEPATPFSYYPDTPFDVSSAVYYKYVNIAPPVISDITYADPQNGSFIVTKNGIPVTEAKEADTITLTAEPNMGFSFASWNVYKTGDETVTCPVNNNTFTMPTYPVTVEAVFSPSPAIYPASRNYDLYAPGDVTATITWHNAMSVTDAVYSIGSDTTEYSLGTGSYSINDDALIIKRDFFEGLSLTEGDSLEFVFTFNTGDEATLMVNVVDSFVPVTTITGVPGTATAGTPLTLTGTVVPNNATNQTVTWSVYNGGDTGAFIVGNILSVTGAGVAVIRATIENGLTASTDYMQDFNIVAQIRDEVINNDTPMPPKKTITVIETSSELFRNSKGKVTVEANMDKAFTSSVEVKVADTTEDDASFKLNAGDEVYPFDISIYIKGTNKKTKPAPGYSVTIFLPIPDSLVDRREDLTVVHKSDNGAVTEIPSRLLQKDGVWYLVFEATEFSPYALVIRNPESYDESEGLPYYLDANGNRIFIGFAVNGKYIAPKGVTVLVTQNDRNFTDISGHWAEEYIGFVTEREIFVGTGGNKFSPDTGMTRAMFATVVGRLHERSYGEIEASDTQFIDCNYDDYYGKYVAWASENGIIGGYGDGRFGPDDEITREQMIAILYRFTDFLNLLPGEMDTILNYPDAASISDYAKQPALYCQTTGIIEGRTGGLFAPKEIATRAEVATIFKRYIGSILKQYIER